MTNIRSVTEKHIGRTFFGNSFFKFIEKNGKSVLRTLTYQLDHQDIRCLESESIILLLDLTFEPLVQYSLWKHA